MVVESFVDMTVGIGPSVVVVVVVVVVDNFLVVDSRVVGLVVVVDSTGYIA